MKTNHIGIIIVLVIAGSFSTFALMHINPQLMTSNTIDKSTMFCFFENDDLLNYLQHPECNRPDGVVVDKGYKCVYKVEGQRYVEAKCEEEGRAWIKNDCGHIQISEELVQARCP